MESVCSPPFCRGENLYFAQRIHDTVVSLHSEQLDYQMRLRSHDPNDWSRMIFLNSCVVVSRPGLDTDAVGASSPPSHGIVAFSRIFDGEQRAVNEVGGFGFRTPVWGTTDKGPWRVCRPPARPGHPCVCLQSKLRVRPPGACVFEVGAGLGSLRIARAHHVQCEQPWMFVLSCCPLPRALLVDACQRCGRRMR